MGQLKAVTKLEIPESFDDTLKDKAKEFSHANVSREYKCGQVALQNVVTYARQKLHEAYNTGVAVGKAEGVKLLIEELENGS